MTTQEHINDDWINMDNEYTNYDIKILIDKLNGHIIMLETKISEMAEHIVKLKNKYDNMENEGLQLKSEIKELKEKQHSNTASRPFNWLTGKNKKLSEVDLLKIDYIRSKNACIRTKSTTGFLPDV